MISGKLFNAANVDSYGTGAVAIQANYFGLFDFSNPSAPTPLYETKEAHFQNIDNVLANPRGWTYSARDYVFSIVFRNHDESVGRVTNQTGNVNFINSVALSTHLHELGHAFSDKGFVSSSPFPPFVTKEEKDCYQHTYYCSGYNKDKCLWNMSCIKETFKQKEAYLQRAA